MFRSARVAALTLCCAGFALAGCSASVHTSSTPTIDKSTLQQGILATLTKKIGEAHAPQSVTCPSGMNAVAGQTLRCTVTLSNGDPYGLTVTITSYTGGNASYDVKVDSHPENN